MYINYDASLLIACMHCSSGVAWGCRWSWDTVGVWKEICYCESDKCNSATQTNIHLLLATTFVLVGFAIGKMMI